MRGAVIYARVSSKEQAEGGYSLDAQLQVCRRLIAERGWALLGEYVDAGESALTSRRPHFQEMLERVGEGGDVAYIVVHKIDRLARNLEDHVTVRAYLKKSGVTLVSATESVDESPQGKLVDGILASIAEFYSANLGQEVRKGMLQKAQAGMWPSYAPVGYRNVRREGGRKAESVLVPDEAMAPLVRQAFELYASGEWGLTDLHREMVKRGMRTIKGTPIQRSTLAQMLRNPIYVGVVRWGQFEIAGKHEPLISRETFDRAVSVLGLKQAGERVQVHHHYLKGTVRCGTCGARLSLTIAKGRFPYFFCIGRSKRRTDCGEAYIPAKDLEAQVEAVYERIKFADETRAEIMASMEREIAARVAGGAMVLGQNRNRLARLASEREKLMQAWYAGVIPMDLLGREQTRIENEIAAIEATANVDVEKLTAARELAEGAMQLLANCRASYVKASDEARGLWNRGLFERIVVSGRKVSGVDYAEPFRTLLAWGRFEQRRSGSPYRIRTGDLRLERATS